MRVASKRSVGGGHKGALTGCILVLGAVVCLLGLTGCCFPTEVGDPNLPGKPQPNVEPVANAGTDQTVAPGTPVTLDGSDSSDADDDPLTYSWSQTDGPSVVLTCPNCPEASFTAPDVTADTVLTFKLKVDDGRGGSATDTVNITIESAKYALTVSVVGEGTVALKPSGGSYEPNTTVTLDATPSNGWRFTRWEDDLTGSTDPATIIMNGNNSVRAVFTFDTTDPNDLKDGLVAHYPFTGDANDASGNGNHGTVIGATLVADRFGNSDSAYSFDGDDDYIDIGSGVKPSLPMTVSLWVKVDTLHDLQTPLFRNDSVNHAANRYGVQVVYVPGGEAYVQTFEGFSAPWNRQSFVTVDAIAVEGEWQHLAVVFQSHDEIHLFLNGVEQDVTYWGGTGSSMAYSSSGHGAIGMEYAGGATYYDGCVDDVRVYNRALSDEEIEALTNLPVASGP